MWYKCEHPTLMGKCFGVCYDDLKNNQVVHKQM